ncbi:YfiR family protein [Larkinella soli]|uniref:YfiR family protein n=1 Tax=Larkinella soli TaxID=1770527 RepID=UPI0013E39A1A|nr:YfiR family protein [Larkinella soli]
MRLLVTWLLIGVLAQARAQPMPASEVSVKAVFIYNFTRFVEWPETAFSSPDAPFVIGIFGADPFGSVMAETVAGEKVGNHPIHVQRYRDPAGLADCHLVYVGSREAEVVREMLASLGRRAVLTVGEAVPFNRMGGMIRFLTRNNKIRFEINASAARAVQLNISSKLLNVAEAVN